ncbi:MAG: gamma-glutamyltransferase [Saprospiraceae bacterium]
MKYKLLCLFWAVLFLQGISFGQLPNLIPFPYDSTKVATGDSAMVVTAHPLATKVGIMILQQGGNAADAAVAVQFTLAVVYPQAGNIGGGGFLVYRDQNGKVAALDYREKAPAAATEKMYLDTAGKVIDNKSRYGIFACGVPGTVDGMWEFHQKYGKLPWARLLDPAIQLAEKGYQISQQEAEHLNSERINFLRYSGIMPAFVKKSKWEAGDWLIQKDLAASLRRIAGDGRAGFYEGATAALIEYEMGKRGGLITKEDLLNYHSAWRAPLEFDWQGLHFITMPPPSSGGIILAQLLKMTGQYPLGSYGFHSSAAIHLMAEAERRAFADRPIYLGDPDFNKIPVPQLTSDAYAQERIKTFQAERVTPSDRVGTGKVKESEETTHYSIVDAQGNAVSVTTTLNDSYGSRVVVSGAGFILNNEMDDFSAKPGAANLYGAIGGKPNAISPGKRPLSSMTPTIITRDGKVSMVVGTPGGTTIPTSVFQIVTNVYVFGLSLPEAVAAGRFHHQWLPDKIMMEENAFPENIVDQLRAKGHNVETRGPIGRVEAIMRLPDGLWQGVADPRGDDCAGGY